MTLSGATTTGQSGPRSDGNKEVLCISKLQNNCSLTIRLFSVISKALIEGVLPLSTDAVDWANKNIEK